MKSINNNKDLPKYYINQPYDEGYELDEKELPNKNINNLESKNYDSKNEESESEENYEDNSKCLKIILDTNLPKPKIWKKKALNDIIIKKYKKLYRCSEKKNYKLVDFGIHPVFEGYDKAFGDHCPMAITPDIIWQLILNGFNSHMAKYNKELRNKFVNFEGKKELVIKRLLTPESANAKDWENIMKEFIDEINKNIGSDVIQNMLPKFSTTTPKINATANISILSSFSHYFKYKVVLVGCGIPYFELYGTLEDWEEIKNKLKFIEKYNLKWWTDELNPIIDKIIDSIKGNIDKKFWKNFILRKEEESEYDGTIKYFDGWIIKFYPYNIHGEKRELDEPLYDIEELPNELLSTPMKMIDELKQEEYDLNVQAGFLGMEQNEKTGCVKPKIGWFIIPETKKKLTKIDDKNYFSGCDENLEYYEDDNNNNLWMTKEKEEEEEEEEEEKDDEDEIENEEILERIKKKKLKNIKRKGTF